MEDASEAFMWGCLVPTRRRSGLPPIIVPKSVIDELDRLADPDDVTAGRARKARSVVKGLIDCDEAECYGEENDGLPDDLFVGVFTRIRLKYRLIIITQANSLAKGILRLNTSSSVEEIHGIDAFRIDDRGYPRRWALAPRDPRVLTFHAPSSADGFTFDGRFLMPPSARPVVTSTSRASSKRSVSRPHVEPFEFRQGATQIDETPVDSIYSPGVGDLVKDANGRSIRLSAMLGAGGEGTAYETDDNLVCKIYHGNRLKKYVVAKLELMTSRKVHHPSICWPASIAYNSLGQVVGYLMPKAMGEELRRTVFLKPLLRKSFPDWTRLHLVRLASTILGAVSYLHSINVLMGDINAANIFVRNESSVSFVDCDSYQVEGFPLPGRHAPRTSLPSCMGRSCALR